MFAALSAAALVATVGVAVEGRGDVIYVAEQDTPGVTELCHSSAKTGAVTKLSSPLIDGGDLLWLP